VLLQTPEPVRILGKAGAGIVFEKNPIMDESGGETASRGSFTRLLPEKPRMKTTRHDHENENSRQSTRYELGLASMIHSL
jgi:hypothetical protein